MRQIMRFLLAFCLGLLASPAIAQTTWPLMRVTYEQYGAVGDCVTDDTVAMMAARDALRAYQDLHAPPDVTPTMISFKPGTCYEYSDNRATWWGLKDLTIEGNGGSLQLSYPLLQQSLLLAGATIVNGNTYKINQPGTIDFTTIGAANNNQNTTFVSTGVTVPAGIGNLVGVTNPNEGVNCTYGITGPICPYTYTGVGPWPSSVGRGTFYLPNRPPIETEPASGSDRVTGTNGFGIIPPGPLLQTVSSGATQVSCVTAGQCSAAAFPQYQAVLITSYNMALYQGYPPNMRYVDYGKVTSANGNTVFLDRPVVYTHLSTNPQEPTNSGTLTAGYGPAMIQPAGDHPGTTAPGIEFGNSITVNNLTFKPVPSRGQASDCCFYQNRNLNGQVNGTTSYNSDWPSDRLGFFLGSYVQTSGAFQTTFNNVTMPTMVPSGVASVTYNYVHAIAGGEIDKLNGSVTFNNSLANAQIAACSSTMLGSVNGGMLASISTYVYPFYCNSRTITINRTTFNSQHMQANNFSSAWSLNATFFPSAGSVANSVFLGGDQSSTPIGGAVSGQTITIDGVKNVAMSSTQLQITSAQLAGNPGAAAFLGCTYAGTVITDTHMATPTNTTIASVVQDPANLTTAGAIITVGTAVFNTGDTVNCKGYQAGSVIATGNTYINYGGAPILP
jgi:hypothetical protein